MQNWAILTLAQKRFAGLLNTKLKMPGKHKKLRILDFMQTGAGCQSSKYSNICLGITSSRNIIHICIHSLQVKAQTLSRHNR